LFVLQKLPFVAIFAFIFAVMDCKIKLTGRWRTGGGIMHKVNTAYSLNDPRKFESIEETEKELNRLRALCIRLKKKQAEEVHFLLGLSVTSHDYVGRMGYDTLQRPPAPLAPRMGVHNNTGKGVIQNG